MLTNKVTVSDINSNRTCNHDTHKHKDLEQKEI